MFNNPVVNSNAGTCDKKHFIYALQLNANCQTKLVVYARHVFCLIDSGATHSYVSDEFYRNHLLKQNCKPTYLGKTMIIQTAGKHPLRLSNVKVVTFSFSVKGDLEGCVQAIVVPNISPPIVLGCSFLSEHNAGIIFNPEAKLPIPSVPLYTATSQHVTRTPNSIVLKSL